MNTPSDLHILGIFGTVVAAGGKLETFYKASEDEMDVN